MQESQSAPQLEESPSKDINPYKKDASSKQEPDLIPYLESQLQRISSYAGIGTNKKIDVPEPPPSPQNWRRMMLTQTVEIPALHKHPIKMIQPLQKRREQMTSEEIEDASWQCNGSDIFKDGCYSGQKSFDLHLGTRAWRCVEQQEGE